MSWLSSDISPVNYFPNCEWSWQISHHHVPLLSQPYIENYKKKSSNYVQRSISLIQILWYPHDPDSKVYGSHMGPMWASIWVPYGLAHMGPIQILQQDPLWVPSGQPIWDPYGTHMGPIWAANMGSIWVPYGSHLGSPHGINMGPIWVPSGQPI